MGEEEKELQGMVRMREAQVNLRLTHSYEACLLFPMFRENSSHFMAFVQRENEL